MTTEIQQLLKETIGLDAASVGRLVIDQIIRGRMAVRGVGEASDYYQQLRADNGEMRELIEAVVIPETSFFRDPESFIGLTQALMTTWLPNHRGQVLRVLSAPCSTGEEPYSIAMALLDAGLSSEQFQIEAVDISTRALAIGTRACYGQNSFRNKDLDFRNRYFRKEKDCYQLVDSVRKRVRFEQGNLLADHFLTGKSYDVIFCRNVLIYFDLPAQKQVIQTLSRLLGPQGLLFVGASEASLLRGTEFVSAGGTATGVYRRGDPKEKGMPLPAAKPRRKPKAVNGSRLPVVKVKSEKIPELPRTDLETARRLGDAGHLREAAGICEEHLRTQPDSVPGYYLLGLIHDAMGEPQRAADLYRKALYLDPDHIEALTHLAVLSAKSGELMVAKRLQDRAGRILQRTNSKSAPSAFTRNAKRRTDPIPLGI